jgi:hypothetical protein
MPPGLPAAMRISRGSVSRVTSQTASDTTNTAAIAQAKPLRSFRVLNAVMISPHHRRPAG